VRIDGRPTGSSPHPKTCACGKDTNKAGGVRSAERKREETMLSRKGANTAIAAAAIVLLTTAANAGAASLTSHEQKLVEGAKQEGAVTVLNPIFSDRTGERLAEAFSKTYDLGSEFKFNNLRKGTGQTVAQVRQEIVASKFTVDILVVSAPGFFDEAAKRGAFAALDSGYWKNHAELAKSAGQYTNYPYVVVPFAYSFQPIWNSSCPGMSSFVADSYNDVVKPELKGKTIASDLSKSFTYTNTALSLQENGVLELNELWDRLKATDPLVEFRSEPKMQMIISCQRPLDMWNLSGRVFQNVLKEPELAKVLKIGHYSEGQVMLGNQAAVLKGAPHPNAAKLFVEFMLSKEGTDIFIEGEAMYSFMTGYKPPPQTVPYVFDLEKTKLLGLKDWVAAAKLAKPVRDAWQAKFQ
jgi:iron(III) transport system substrate-binding protein